MPASIQAANSPEIEPREKNLEKEEAASKNGDSKNEKNEENSIEEIKESENSSEITQQPIPHPPGLYPDPAAYQPNGYVPQLITAANGQPLPPLLLHHHHQHQQPVPQAPYSHHMLPPPPHNPPPAQLTQTVPVQPESSSPRQNNPNPLKELELHDTMVAASAPAYQPAHMFPGLGYTQEIVDLEVTAGMEITLPNCDGTQNMYRGPVRISMPVSPGMPLPIAPPIGYQVYMRLDTDPNTGHMKKVYSVLPGPYQIQHALPMQHVSHEAAPQYATDFQQFAHHEIAQISEQQKAAKVPSKGAETDEEKKNIKSTLSKIDSPKIVKVSHNFALLKWNKVKSDEKSELNEENLSYILEIRNTTSAHDDAWKLVYQGLMLEYEVLKLIPENNYLSRVKARYLNIEGDCSPVQNFKTEAISNSSSSKIENREKSPEMQRPHKRGKGDYEPKSRRSRISAPDNLKAKKTSSSSIDVSWSPMAGVTKYILQMKQITHRYHDDDSFKTAFEGQETHYSFRELKKAARYRFRVAGLTKDGQSDFSKPCDESTGQDPPTQPSRPIRTRLEKNSNVSEEKSRALPLYNVTLEWKAPKETGGSSIVEFKVQQRYASQNQSAWELKYKGSETSHVFTDLLPGSKIEYRVQAVNQHGMASVWSLPEMINTPPGRPLAPKKIDVRNIGTDCCSLSWSVGLCVAGGSVSRYEIQLTEVGYYDHKTESEPVVADDSDERVQFKDGLRSAREATLENLLSGRTYKVHLRTVNSGNEESDWNSTEFQTLADAPSVPESPSVTSVQSDAVAIEWREPVANGSPITGYYVQIKSEGKTLSLNVNSTKLERTGLAANTHFVFKVAAINSVGQSGFSSPCSVKTNASIPHVPKLSVSLMPNSTPIVRQWALLQWPKPQDQGSKITSYTVEYKKSSDERCSTVVSGEDDRVEIDDLEPEETYRFRMRAVNDRGPSPWADWIHVKTKPLPPTAPVLKLLEVHPTSVKLQWTDSNNKYMLQRHSKGSWKVIYRGEKSYNKISKLLEGSIYRFRVSASNSSGDGPFSSIFEVTTPRCPPPNIRRAPLVAANVENRCATISWTTENAALSDLKFRVELLRGDETLRNLATSKTEIKIENLDTNVNYAVRVQAQRDGQWADSSPEKPFCLVFKEVKEVKEAKKTTPSMKKIFEEDSITALLVFAFAIVAVLIALCGHHWQTS